MDVIELRLYHCSYGRGKLISPAVDIFINGRNLHLMINDFYPDTYSYRRIDDMYDALTKEYKTDSVYIYGCGCGRDYAFVLVNIDVGEKTVTWYDFTFGSLEYTADTDGKIGCFVFDKRQYFEEVEKIRFWICNQSLTVSYGNISYGYLTLFFSKNDKRICLTFDDLTCDPIPQMVRLLSHVSNGEDCEETIYDMGEKIFSISVYHTDQMGLMQLEVEIPKHNLIFYDIYDRSMIEDMLKDIFRSLLQDPSFPYAFPCYCRLVDDDEVWEKIDHEVNRILASNPDADREALFTQLLGEGKIPLTDAGKQVYEQYKAMLRFHTILEG